MVYSKPEWTIPKPSSQAVESVVIFYHCWIENGKPARSESCDLRGRPCFAQVFRSKIIQLQQTFTGSFPLPSSQFSSVVLICTRKARKTR